MTIIAAFNGVLIGLAAWVVGVPLAGTIAVVTFVAAYVPFVGAWVAGAFAVLIALGTVGTDAAVVMAVVSLLANSVLQQVIQPFVMGATLSLNPLVVLVVTIGAGALFGMVGLTLAAPLTSAAVHIANELHARSDGSARSDPAPAGTPPEAAGPGPRARAISCHVVSHRNAIGRWNRSTRKHTSAPCCVPTPASPRALTVSSSASASPTFSAAAGPRELGRARPDMLLALLAPPGGARPGRTRAAGGDRSGLRHTGPYRLAGRDRRPRATRVRARRAGPATRRPVTCERAYAAEPRRSSSELDDLWLPCRCRRRSGTPMLPSWGQRATLAQRTGGIRATCRPGPDNPDGDRTQHDSAGQGPAR